MIKQGSPIASALFELVAGVLTLTQQNNVASMAWQASGALRVTTTNPVQPNDFIEVIPLSDGVKSQNVAWVTGNTLDITFSDDLGPVSAAFLLYISRENSNVSAIAATGVAPGAGTFSAAIQQQTWFVDNVAGSDANDGLTALTALATMAEWYRRTEGKFVLSPVLTLLDNSSGERWIWPVQRVGDADGRFTVTGLETETAAGGPVSAFTDYVPATNAKEDFQTAAFDFTPFIGQKIVMTSGAANGRWAWIQDAPGLAQATPSYFVDSNGTNANPAPADTYVFRVPTVSLEILTADQTPEGDEVFANQLRFQNLIIISTNGFQGGKNPVFEGCIFGAAGFINLSKDANFIGNFFDTGGAVISIFDGFQDFRGNLFQTSPIILGEGANSFWDFNVFYDSQFALGTTDFLGGSADLGGENGFYDNTGAAIQITNAGRFVCGGALFGSGNIRGFNGLNGAFCQFDNQPTLTATVGTEELRFDGSATLIPPLTAGAVVPAAANCRNWAEFAAGPFNGHYANGAFGTVAQIV